MTAFCVFGMTEPIARAAARKAWGKHVAAMTKEARAYLTESDETDWIDVKTDYLLAKAKPVQASGAFDAPQFARDYIALAKRNHRTSRLEVMARGEKRDASGAPRISKATKKPIIGWIPFKFLS
ncbi:hypothetical protein L522_1768 [Bordetella bronchiseptica MBORD707]|nr:hypothetical protein L522_1768 [Bordetella bronchiseptica MBORD707]